MPDAYGNFKSITVPADAWERIFGTVKTHDLSDGRVALCGQSAIRPHRCDHCPANRDNPARDR